MKAISEGNASSVLSKPGFWTYLLIALMGMCAVSFCTLPFYDSSIHPDGRLPMFFMGLFIAAGCLLGLLWAWRSYVYADYKGVRWRTLFHSRSVTWHEISDYYHRIPAQGKQENRRAVVVTRKGKIKLTSDFTHHKKLLQFIQANATQAKAKEWGVYQCRFQDDPPLKFGISTADTLMMPVLIGALLIASLNLFLPSIKSFHEINQMGIGWAIAIYTTLFFVALGQPLVFMLLIGGTLSRSWKRRGENWSVDQTGIEIKERDGNRRFIAWNEVTGLKARRGKLFARLCDLQTTQGDFELFFPLMNRLMLRALRVYATNLTENDWENFERTVSDEDAGPRTTNSGELVFHYRNRTNRAMLLFLVGMTVVNWLGFFINAYWIDETRPRSYPPEISVFLTLLCFWAIYRYRVARIVLDKNGITAYTSFGKKRLYWSQIDGFEKVGGDLLTYGVIKAGKQKIVFHALLDSFDQFQRELRERAPQLPQSDLDALTAPKKAQSELKR